jgi:hypothetical protein
MLYLSGYGDAASIRMLHLKCSPVNPAAGMRVPQRERAVVAALKKLRYLFDSVCGKRLAVALPTTVDTLGTRR